MVVIYLSNSAMHEHICLGIIKKLYKFSGIRDYQKQYKAIIEAEMVSTPEVFTDKNAILPSQTMTVKKKSARESLRHFFTNWNSNLIMLSTGFVPLNKSAKKSYMAVCCGPVYQRGGGIQKAINRLKILLQLDSTTSSGCSVSNRK